MPNIIVRTNVPIDEEKKKYMLTFIAKLTADIMNKPISDVMVMYAYNDLLMAETFEPAAFIDFNCISGFDVKVGQALCQGIYDVLNETIRVEASRVYIKFFEVKEIHAWRFINNEPVCPGLMANSEVK